MDFANGISIRESCFLCKKQEDKMFMQHNSRNKKIVVSCENHKEPESWEFTNPIDYQLDREGNLIIDIEYNTSMLDERTKITYNFYSAITILKKNGEKRFFCTYDAEQLIKETQEGEGDLI